MASTTTRRSGALRPASNGTKGAGIEEPRLAPARRRSPLPLIVAILCIAGSALAGLVAYRSTSGRQSVLATTHAIPVGHALRPADLAIVDLSTDGGVTFVLATDENSIVGRPLAVPLAAGVPLTQSDLAAAPGLDPGQAVVAVLCKAGQYPPSLTAGDRVEVMDSGASSAMSGMAPQASGSTPFATVLGVDVPSDTATVGTVISLRVSSADAGAVTRLAGAGRATLVLVPSGS